MNDYRCRPERDAVTAVDLVSTRGLLARYKRASLGRQAMRAAWDLGALVRRVEHEAPEVHRRLLDAVKVLQQIALQHEVQPGGERDSRPTVGESATDQSLSTGGLRQGELF